MISVPDGLKPRFVFELSGVSLAADGLAYSALLKNELLGAGIEKVQDPQTEDRRLQPSTPEKRSLFNVSIFSPTSGSTGLDLGL